MSLARRLASPRNDAVERELRMIPFLNSLVAASLRWEPRRLGRRKRLPVGTSLLALARKSPAHAP